MSSSQRVLGVLKGERLMADAITKDQTRRLLVPSSLEPNHLLIGGEPGGKPTVSIDLETGEVTLRRPVLEASRLFWDAVSKLVSSGRN